MLLGILPYLLRDLPEDFPRGVKLIFENLEPKKTGLWTNISKMKFLDKRPVFKGEVLVSWSVIYNYTLDLPLPGNSGKLRFRLGNYLTYVHPRNST